MTETEPLTICLEASVPVLSALDLAPVLIPSTIPAIALAAKVEQFRVTHGEATFERAKELATTGTTTNPPLTWERAMEVAAWEKVAAHAGAFVDAMAELERCAGIGREALADITRALMAMVPPQTWRRKPARGRRRKWARRG